MRARIPFGVHQAAEYVIGVGLLLGAVHAGSGAPVVAGAGVCVLGISALTDGPLGGWRALSPVQHRVCDAALVVILGACPFLVAGLSPVAVGALVAAAAVLVWLMASSAYVRPPRVERHSTARRIGRLLGSRPRGR